MIRLTTNRYQSLNAYVRDIQQQIGATAAAVYVIQNDAVVNEWYSGKHDAAETSRAVDAFTRFNVGSARKTYLALAISLLMKQGHITSMDDEIASYLAEYKEMARGVTLRHLLTHTHGLTSKQGKLASEFAAGEDWAYRNTGIALLFELVQRQTGHSLSEWMRRQVFEPYDLNETGWEIANHEHLIYNYYGRADNWVGPNDSGAGDQSNLFVSTRDFAKWGYIHLRQGSTCGEQHVPQAVFARVVRCATPSSVPADRPRNGFIWWLQHDTPLNHLGERLPQDSYMILGITGCACLILPSYDAVVVRMYNQLSPSEGYDYLSDIRTFGNMANDLLSDNVKV